MSEQEQELHARDVEASRLNTINKIESLDPDDAVEGLHAIVSAQGTLKHIAELAESCKQADVALNMHKLADSMDVAIRHYAGIILAHLSVVKHDAFGKVMLGVMMKAMTEMAAHGNGGTAPTDSAPVAPAPSPAPVK